MIENEVNIHKKLGTREPVTPLLNANIFGSWIVLCYKLGKDGGVSSRKLRLVTQGFIQQEGIDYNNTFLPTAKLTAVWNITAISIRNDWELEQTHVNVAYLNASLKENIYMRQLKGFEIPGQEDKVIHLKLAIYRLRQSGCEWYEDFMSTLTNVGFKRCKVEHAMFYRFDQDTTILAVDVDDITIATNSPRAIKQFKDNLSSRYGIKDMGSL